MFRFSVRHVLSAVSLILFLGACAPVLVPDSKRDGETVVITLAPTVDLYGVTVSILNATTDDARCAVQAERDVGCVLGDLPANTSTTITVTGPPGEVWCRAFGYTNANTTLNNYRTWVCHENEVKLQEGGA